MVRQNDNVQRNPMASKSDHDEDSQQIDEEYGSSLFYTKNQMINIEAINIEKNITTPTVTDITLDATSSDATKHDSDIANENLQAQSLHSNHKNFDRISLSEPMAQATSNHVKDNTTRKTSANESMTPSKMSHVVGHDFHESSPNWHTLRATPTGNDTNRNEALNYKHQVQSASDNTRRYQVNSAVIIPIDENPINNISLNQNDTRPHLNISELVIRYGNNNNNASTYDIDHSTVNVVENTTGTADRSILPIAAEVVVDTPLAIASPLREFNMKKMIMIGSTIIAIAIVSVGVIVSSLLLSRRSASSDTMTSLNSLGSNNTSPPSASLAPTISKSLLNFTTKPTIFSTTMPSTPFPFKSTTIPPTPASILTPNKSFTMTPTEALTENPTEKPTEAPIEAPTEKPTKAPTVFPTTLEPTSLPTVAVTDNWDIDWIQIGNDIEGCSSDKAGKSVATSRNGRAIAIGAPGYSYYNHDDTYYDDSNTTIEPYLYGTNYVDIYLLNYSKWEIIATIFGATDFADATGQSIALDDTGSIVAIGSPKFMAPSENDPSDIMKQPGLVRVYRTIPESFNTTQIGSKIKGQRDGDEFGWSIDLSNDATILAIAARTRYVQVYQYSKEIDEWIEYGQIINCTMNGEYYADDIGISVRLSGDGTVLIIGEPGGYKNNDISSNSDTEVTGNVNVYRMITDNNWIQIGETLVGDNLDEEFGYSVAISDDGNIIAVCAPKNSAGQKSSYIAYEIYTPTVGSCQVYQYNVIQNIWNQLGKNINGKEVNELFGSSVSLNSLGNIIAIGAMGSNKNGEDSGLVRILEYNTLNDTWNIIGNDIVGDNAFASSGGAIALSSDGDFITIGATNEDMIDSDGQGTARVYETGIIMSQHNSTINPSSHNNTMMNITIVINPGDCPYEVRWYIDRLDFEQIDIMYMIQVQDDTYWFANETDIRTIFVPCNGVYRFFGYLSYGFVDIYVDGKLVIFNLTYYDQYTFTTSNVTTTLSLSSSANASSTTSNWEIINSVNSSSLSSSSLTVKTITLEIDFDEKPYDIHWVIVKREKKWEGIRQTIFRSIVAYGPKHEYGSEYSNTKYQQTMNLSSSSNSDDDTYYTFILTDDGLDGLCCHHGLGSVRIYNGTRNSKSSSTSNDTSLLLENSVEGMRKFVQTFQL